MGCCYHDEHDYCCECYDFEDRVIDIIEDILTGTPKSGLARKFLQDEDAEAAAKKIYAALRVEDVV